MQKIVPHLWFDKEAGEAARFYTSVFPGSSVAASSVLDGTPSGRVETLRIVLSGQEFLLISAGPYFTFNPSVSFLAACDTRKEADALWGALREGGRELMPLGSYPFSERYGWLMDKYGLSWQIMYMGGIPYERKLTPTLMFVGGVCGRAEEAVRFYASVFRGRGWGTSCATAPGRRRTRKARSSTSDSRWRASPSPPWTAPRTMPSPLTKPSRSWSGAGISGGRLLLGAAVRQPRIRAVRLAQGQVRPFLADRAGSPGPDDGRRGPPPERPGHGGLPGNEKARHRGTPTGLRGRSGVGTALPKAAAEGPPRLRKPRVRVGAGFQYICPIRSRLVWM